MALIDDLRSNLSGGAISERLFARRELELYRNGARRIKNWRLLLEGGVKTRGSFAFTQDLTYRGASKFQIEQFFWDEDEDYLLVFYDDTIEIYDATGQTLHQTITGQPWVAANIGELDSEYYLDATVIVHNDFKPQLLLRTGATTFASIAWIFDRAASGYPVFEPYYKFVGTTTTLTPGATTGAGVSLVASDNVFVADHVGVNFRLDHGGGYKTVEIASVIDAKNATCDIKETLGGTTATQDWDEAAFSDARGWPATVRFYKNRTIFANTPALPNGFWTSKSNSFFNFDVGTGLDDESIQYVMVESGVQEIREVIARDDLFLITDHGGFAQEVTAEFPFTPGNFAPIRVSGEGIRKFARAANYDDAVMFPDKSNKVIREIVWNELLDKNKSQPVSIPAPDLITSAKTCYVQTPPLGERQETYLYVLNDDGTLAVLHSLRDQRLGGWVQYDIAGDGTETIEDICVVDRTLHAIVKRTISGNTRYFLETLDASRNLDCSITYSGAAVSNIPGLNHLIGQQVAVNSGNLHYGTYTVNGSGEVDISPYAVTTAEVGYAPDAEIETLPPAFEFRGKTWFGEPMRIVNLFVDLYSALALTGNGQYLVIKQATDDMSQDPSPVNGVYKFKGLGWQVNPTTVINRQAPLPAEIRGLMQQVHV